MVERVVPDASARTVAGRVQRSVPTGDFTVDLPGASGAGDDRVRAADYRIRTVPLPVRIDRQPAADVQDGERVDRRAGGAGGGLGRSDLSEHLGDGLPERRLVVRTERAELTEDQRLFEGGENRLDRGLMRPAVCHSASQTSPKMGSDEVDW